MINERLMFKEGIMLNDRNTPQRRPLKERLERLMMAVTFAEAGEHATALEMMERRPEERPRLQRQQKSQVRKDRRPVLMA